MVRAVRGVRRVRRARGVLQARAVRAFRRVREGWATRGVCEVLVLWVLRVPRFRVGGHPFVTATCS